LVQNHQLSDLLNIDTNKISGTENMSTKPNAQLAIECASLAVQIINNSPVIASRIIHKIRLKSRSNPKLIAKSLFENFIATKSIFQNIILFSIK
jgi:hypothetical protein